MTPNSLTNDVSTSPQLTGQVKWFNNKAGFGFITVLTDQGELSGKEIFVHFTSIEVKNNQYKYLVQGEYVDFSLVKLDGSNHEFHAVNVHGIKGGSLMCETRKQTNEERIAKPAKETSSASFTPTTRKEAAEEVGAEVRRRTSPRKQGSTRPSKTFDEPRQTSGDGEYTKVYRKRSAKPRVKAASSAETVAETTA